MQAFDPLRRLLHGKKVLILGYGREGRSTHEFLSRLMPDLPLTIADKNENLLPNPDTAHLSKADCVTGENYLQQVSSADVVVKSPGIPLKILPVTPQGTWITSQTEWFLMAFRNQTIGVTGTKGKSTTASLLHHILQHSGRPSVLLGNIGIPPLSAVESMRGETTAVFEISSHQLQGLPLAPATAVLLNIFQEHLDHYHDLSDYQNTKYRIASQQNTNDRLIYYLEDPVITNLIRTNPPESKLFPVSLLSKPVPGCYLEGNLMMLQTPESEQVILHDVKDSPLPGRHNLINIMAAIQAAFLSGIEPSMMESAIRCFKPLEHRIEYFGTFRGIRFYNDSISTIPEATMEALRSVNGVKTLILGGYDRNIEYQHLIEFLCESNLDNVIFTGEAGKRMMKILNNRTVRFRTFFAEDYKTVMTLTFKHTHAGDACLLSPAASSYDRFRNFEDRGNTFKKMVSEFTL